MRREGYRSKSAGACPAGKHWTGQSLQSRETITAVIKQQSSLLGGAALPTKAPELRAWPKPGLPLAPYSQVPSVSSGSSSVPAFHPPRLLQPLSPSQKARPSPTALPLQPHRRHAGSRGSCQRVVSWRAAGLSSSSFAAARGCFSPCLLHVAHRQSLSLSARHFSGSRRHSPCSRAPSC